jgi:TolB-like protein/DNA-binding winged helix-turn-helix (wHTH) protein/Flp pilus assembly protein TadD
MEANPPDQRLRFEPFEVDLRSGELYKQGQKVRLERLPFHVLALLLEQPGQLVTREQLHRKLWATDTFVDFEAGLNTAIRKLREALGDSRGTPRFIETLPRRGYRFIAPIQQPASVTRAAEVTPIHVSSSAVATPRASRRRTLRAAAIGVALFAVVLGGWSFAIRRARPTETPTQDPAVDREQIRSMAVLPFKALTGGNDPTLEVGMADALITKLSNVREIVVRPSESVLKYTTGADDPVAAGRELKVDAVLVGAVQRADDRIRVTARLLGVQDGRPLWGDHFDEPWTQIFGVQDSISERVVHALTLELTGRERERLTRHDTQNLEAYQAYQTGRSLGNRLNAEGIQKARDYFERAIALDRGYALAYSGLADSYARFPAFIGGAPKDPFERARAAALRAMHIDDAAAEPHASLGRILVQYDYDWSGAEREFKRALDLNPNYATAHHWYGVSYLSLVGRHTEAIAELKRAQDLDPLSLMINTDVGRPYYYAHLYDHAIEQYQKTLEMDPTFWAAHHFLARAYAQKGKYEEALAELREVSHNTVEPRATLAYTYALSGQRSQATRVLQELLDLAQRQYVPRYHIAIIYAGLNDRNQALTWLEKAYEERDQWLNQLKVEPMLDGLHREPRFQALVARVFERLEPRAGSKTTSDR